MKIIGFEDKMKIFQNLIEKDLIVHAYLFYGEPEIGKFSFAKALAYYLEYQKFELLNYPLIDCLILEPHQEKNHIFIEDVRKIKEFLYQKPFKSKKRLVILDEAHTLTFEAQIALLKIVEEPPKNSLIILITYEPSLINPPLLSRFMKVYFGFFSFFQLKEILQNQYHLKTLKAEKIAKLSFGRLGRALKILKGNLEDIPLTQKEIEDKWSLIKFLEDKIVSFYLEDRIKNREKIIKLLKIVAQLRNYNLNFILQKKLAEAILSK